MSDIFTVIIESFAGNTPAVQREIVTAIFSTLVIKDRKLIASLKAPFSFSRERELLANSDEEPRCEETLQKQMP